MKMTMVVYFTSDSEYLRIINLSKLRNITPEQQFDLAEHNQDLERDKLTYYCK